MLSRVLVALGLAAAVVSAAAMVFLRTDFVANNLCAYAVATIEEATAARVQVSQCSVQPEQGKLTIEGLRVGDPGGRIDLKVARVFAQVTVRPLLQKVRLERLEIDHPQLRLALDEAGGSPAKGGQCLPDVLDRFEFGRVRIRKASVEVRSSGAQVEIPRLGLAIKGSGPQLSVSVSTRGGSVELPGRAIGLISSRTAALVDLRGSGALELRRADVIGTEASLFVKGKLDNLCDPQLEMAANVRIDDLEKAAARLIPGKMHDIKGGVSADATVSWGRGAPHVRGDLRLKAVALGSFFPGDTRLRFDLTPSRVRVDRLEVPAGRGQINGSLELSLADTSLPLTADLQLHDMELAELLHKLGLQHAWVVLRASGRVQAKGTMVPFNLAGDTALELADFAVLDRTYEKRAQARKMFEFSRGKLAAALLADADKIVAQGIAIEVGGSRVQVESTFFTDQAKGMQIAAHTENLSLDDFRGHFGPLPASGTLKLAASASGPYQALAIEGRTAGQDVHFMELSLGDVTTHVAFDTTSTKLTFEDIRGHKDQSEYRGRIAIDFSSAATPLEAHVELPEAYLNDLVDLASGMVPALSAIEDPREVDGRVAGVIDVKGPAASPLGTASLQFRDLSLWGESFDAGEARLSLHGNEPRLQIEDLTLRHGEAALRVSGRFGPKWQLDLDARTENFTLADFDRVERAHLSGPLRATAHLGGVPEHPRLDVALQFTEGMADEADLGEGELKLRIDDKAMTWNATIGTHRVSGHARLEGDFPYTCEGTLRVPDLPQYVDLLAPDFDIESGSLTAAFEVRGALLRLRESAGTMTLSQLLIVRSDLPFENDGPAQVSFGPEGIRCHFLFVHPELLHDDALDFVGYGHSTLLHVHPAVHGQYVPCNIRCLVGSKEAHRGSHIVGGHVMRNALLPVVTTSGAAMGALIGGAVATETAFGVPGLGTYLVQATVGGTLKNPTVLGNIRIEDGAGSLRGLPVAARALNGSISFSQDALVIDSLSGKLNNGEARVAGGMEMERLVPKKIDMSAHVSDVNVHFQESVGAIVDGDLTLHGPPSEPMLGGNLTLSQMKYTEDVDIEKSLLDFSRRPPAPKVLTKSPIVVRFDLDVHLSRGVRVENNLARTDLKGDLKITGTSRSIGLLGSVNTVHGTATFRGNEFQIEQGVLTFTDRQRIRPTFDFQASSQVKEYKVRLHAFGTPGEPHVSLSSEPALADADLGSPSASRR